MGNHERPRYSRFQVLTEGRPAWAQDDRGAVFYFDSLRFWQPKRRGRRQIVASWQSPSYGWEHEPQCLCRLCVLSGLHGAAAAGPETHPEAA